jgi:hypothetical protein
MNKNIRNIDQVSSSLSIEALEEIVHNCQRNEQRLHELKRHTRHERKKAERLLREIYHTKQMSTSLTDPPKPRQQPIEFFVSFNDDNDLPNTSYQSHREVKPSFEKFDSKTHRVRFNLPEKDHHVQNEGKKPTTNDDELVDLSRRCENLLSRIQTHTTVFDNSADLPNNESINLQQALELLRPEFILNSRQRVARIHHLREDREHHQTLPSSDSNSFQIPFTYQEMKQASKKKYDQLPEVNHRLQQDLMNEIKQRNYLRAKIFRIRLRQHVLLHGRTNIDESLTMIDT